MDMKKIVRLVVAVVVIAYLFAFGKTYSEFKKNTEPKKAND